MTGARHADQPAPAEESMMSLPRSALRHSRVLLVAALIAAPASGGPFDPPGGIGLDPCLFDPLPASGCEQPDFSWDFSATAVQSFGPYAFVTLRLRNRGGAAGTPAQTLFTIEGGEILSMSSPEPMWAWSDVGIWAPPGTPGDPTRWTTLHSAGLGPGAALTVHMWVRADAGFTLLATANSDFHWGSLWLPEEITRANNVQVVHR